MAGSLDRLYLGNPMDPPDILGLDQGTARPTQLPGRAKKSSYNPINGEDDSISSGIKRLSLKKTTTSKGLKLVKPSARVAGTKVSDRHTLGIKSSSFSSGDVALIDFGEDISPLSPGFISPVVEQTAPSLAKLAMDAFSLLDKTPPQSPSRSLPRPLHPTPVVDWDTKPLPAPPAYDEVAQDEDDFEVCTINSPDVLLAHREKITMTHLQRAKEKGEANYGYVQETERAPVQIKVEDNLFLPPKDSKHANISQTSEIFEELQQECMKRLNVPQSSSLASTPSPSSSTGNFVTSSEDKPQIPPRIPIPPRPIRREHERWSGELSPAFGAEEVGRAPLLPPRDPLSQPTSRTPSPMTLQVGSPQQRSNLCSPLCIGLSTSPGKQMPTTQSFASDPKYATPKVIQAQGKDSSKGPCILPIVKDGKKVSNTHYYLLPERPPYLDKYEKFLKEARSPEETSISRSISTATVRPMVQQTDYKANFSSNNSNCSSKSAVKTSCSLQKIVQEMVHGVTTEECQAALQNHGWNVQKAIQYLKVEQLFCLGLKTRTECHKVLETFDWNLETASSHLLESYNDDTSLLKKRLTCTTYIYLD
ncbi:hypothetical protein AB205_0113960 [Aquarana catesbeiana]|uniref:UBA domain-containing protein n=1 Tax=Aquarana catesbeiana TaxID=8400 RepID=A0A2G9RHE4_AQUCT|nr:hypothetical protein AB205_0113960 [Aquarana catesbeiana]